MYINIYSSYQLSVSVQSFEAPQAHSTPTPDPNPVGVKENVKRPPIAGLKSRSLSSLQIFLCLEQ